MTNPRQTVPTVYNASANPSSIGTLEWAQRAGWQDSCLLITPRARERALAILDNHRDDISNAARTILLDGGAWQGVKEYAYADMTTWANAQRTLDGHFKGRFA